MLGRQPERPTPVGDPGFELAIARIEEKLPEWWKRGRQPSGAWIATVAVPHGLGVRVSGPSGGRCALEVKAFLFDLELPPGAHAELVMFCAIANRFFRHCNLYIAPDADLHSSSPADVERLVSQATFIAREGGVSLPAQMIELVFWHTLRGAFVAAPAVQAILDGADAREALSIADRHFDDFSIDDLLGHTSTGKEGS